MKRILLTALLAVGLNAFVSAQEQLEVEYEVRMVMDYEKFFDQTASKMGDQAAYMTKEIKNMLAEEMSKPVPYLLKLNKDESMYEKIQTINNSQSMGGFSMEMGGVSYYKNLKENYLYQIIESPGETIMVKDSLNSLDWVITKESQEILGYEVRKATAIQKDELDDDKPGIQITAWYAPKLAFKNGPESYGGLPGLILKLEMKTKDDSSGLEVKQLIETMSIKPSKNKKKIGPPSKGKVMTKEEFKEMMNEAKEKIKEKMSDNGSSIMIFTE